MRITVISGGEAGARFTGGLLDHLDSTPDLAGSRVSTIANTGDDVSLWGLRLCPDLDLHLRAAESTKGTDAPGSRVVADDLATLGLEPHWYPVTDREMAVHVARTAWLGRGDSLTEVTARMARARGLDEGRVQVLPMSDVPVETHAVLEGPEEQQAVHVQQWRHEMGHPPVARFVVAGLDRATPGPEVLAAIRTADVVLLAPADPVLTLGIVLGVPGVRDALRGTSAPVVGVSPVGSAPAAQPLLTSLATVGVDPDAASVAGLFRDLLDGWVVDPADAGRAVPGSRCTTRAHTAPLGPDADPVELAATALGLATSLRP